MAEMTCSGCGTKKRVQQLPLGPRIINHARAGTPEVVKEQREARVLLRLAIAPNDVATIGPVTVTDPDGDLTLSVEEQIVAAKDMALSMLDAALTPSELAHQKTAIYDAALALVEASRATGKVEGPVLVEVTVEKPTREACPGSGKAPAS